jgi:heme/copper-type cytochrome/quinol oxidase subunit 3
VRNLKKKMTLMVVGVILILIALILGALQHFYYGTLPNNQNIYGSGANKWYFYVLVGIVGLIGIILVAWSLIIVEAPAKTTQPTQPAQ